MKTLVKIYYIFLSLLTVSFANETGRYGVCAHPFTANEYSIKNDLYDMMKIAGVDWLRTDFRYDIINPSDGVYDFKMFDDIVDELRKRGISMLGLITNGQLDWKSQQSRERWSKYITATVAHYKGRVSHWEILNEHDYHKNRSHLKSAEDGQTYGELLKIAYTAVKAGNPNAVVLYGGLTSAPKNSPYIEASIKVAANAFDIMNFHQYHSPKAPEPFLKDAVEYLNGLMEKYNTKRPIWLTEIGSTTPAFSESALPIVKMCCQYLGISNLDCVYALKSGTLEKMGKKAKKFFPNAKKIKVVTNKQIKELPDNGVLLTPSLQSFNHDYTEDLVDFVRRGGTVIYSGGGFPFLFNKGGQSTTNVLNQLRVELIPSWKIDKKMPIMFKVRETDVCVGFEKYAKQFKKSYQNFRTFNYTDKLLKPEDKFIPVFKGKYGNNELIPAAIYKFNSDFKGTLILISLHDNLSDIATEKQQAEYVARYFLFGFSNGIEKIFNYSFRSHGNGAYQGNFGLVRKDLSEKPAYKSYQFSRKILGEKAKPKYTFDANTTLSRAEWTTPDGKPAIALWTQKDKVKTTLNLKNAPYEIFKISGEKIKEYIPVEDEKPPVITIKIEAKTAPVYIIGTKIKE